MWSILTCARFLAPLAWVISVAAAAETCTYETWTWDSVQKKVVNLERVQKTRSDLTSGELGTVEGCSVCEQDQIEISVDVRKDQKSSEQGESLKKFKVCKKYRKKISSALKAAIDAGFPISSLVGYRVGKSKGPLNSLGQRTEFSNHSYGVALDINSEKNGLYDFCPVFSPACKLIRGGPYVLSAPGTILGNSILYTSMLKEGLKWGGEIQGKQKDFMHFSPTGT